ncbi:MAG: hypothetical protein ABFR33_00225 [Verrucomicrobiota bacterium]
MESAWIGEGVPLSITLRAPGPFSGTAVFDLPELPHTFIIKQGGPTVGSETAGGETWMTQHHEFRVYTQTGGIIELPAIRVRFNAKKDFVSKPEPHEGRTSTLDFESRRPPGTESGQVVVATPHMQIEQSWSAWPDQMMKAGDVVERRIVRRATKTTAMVFPDLPLAAPKGVRVYRSPVTINDKTARGESSAERIDTIKYQFSGGGIFQLPEMKFTWWDPKTEQLKERRLEGASFEIEMQATESTDQQSGYLWAWGLVAIALLWRLKTVATRIQNHLHHPERLAAKAVVAACRKNQPSEAYASLMQWSRITGIKLPQESPLADERKILSRTLYSTESTSWKGRALASAFKSFLKQLLRKKLATSESPALPGLNPTSPSTGTRPVGGKIPNPMGEKDPPDLASGVNQV